MTKRWGPTSIVDAMRSGKTLMKTHIKSRFVVHFDGDLSPVPHRLFTDLLAREVIIPNADGLGGNGQTYRLAERYL